MIRYKFLVVLTPALLASAQAVPAAMTTQPPTVAQPSSTAQQVTMMKSSGAAASPSPAYRLHIGDTVSVFYRITPEYNQSLTILPDGNIDLRFVGQVHLEDLNVNEASRAIATLASRRLRDPEVSVSVTDFVHDQVTIMGEVGKPGRYELHGPTSIVDGLANAGGFTQLSAQRHVVLVRPLDAHSEYGNATAFDFKHLLNDQRTTPVPMLKSGDIIIVTTSKFAKITGIIRLLNVGLYYNPASGF